LGIQALLNEPNKSAPALSHFADIIEAFIITRYYVCYSLTVISAMILLMNHRSKCTARIARFIQKKLKSKRSSFIQNLIEDQKANRRRKDELNILSFNQ
jgi:hypothetical protein